MPDSARRKDAEDDACEKRPPTEPGGGRPEDAAAPASGVAAPPAARSGPPERTDEELLAIYTAARGFLAAEWAGAILMVASFTLLYLLVWGPADVAPSVVLPLSAGVFVLGTAVYWQSRAYYRRLGFPHRRRWEAAAAVVAGSGAIFWLLFLLLWLLVWLGLEVY